MRKQVIFFVNVFNVDKISDVSSDILFILQSDPVKSIKVSGYNINSLVKPKKFRVLIT